MNNIKKIYQILTNEDFAYALVFHDDGRHCYNFEKVDFELEDGVIYVYGRQGEKWEKGLINTIEMILHEENINNFEIKTRGAFRIIGGC